VSAEQIPKKQRLITLVCSHYYPHLGGVERFVSLQAKECVRLGFAVRIITHDTEKLGFVEEQPGITIYRLPYWSPLPHSRFPLVAGVRELCRLFRTSFSHPGELTVVHTRYYPLSLVGCFLARLTGTRLVLIDHSSDYIRLGSRALNVLGHIYEHLLTFLILLFRPQVFGVAHRCVHWLRRFGIRRASVCYNGIDLTEQALETTPLSEIIGPIASRHVVLAVGRLVKEKGVIELVEGFCRFAEGREDYVLVIIGYGDLEPMLRTVAEADSKIIFLGRQPISIVMSCMRQSWVMVNPSNYPEGLPSILLEAGQCGLAVISTPNGGAGEIFEDGETAIMIQSGNPAEIEQALKRLDEAPKLRKTIARNFQTSVESRFIFSTIMERFLFEDVMLSRSEETTKPE